MKIKLNDYREKQTEIDLYCLLIKKLIFLKT